MKTYQKLLEQEIEKTPLRELARKISVPPPSLHNYLYMGTEPRMAALEKMSKYFLVPVSDLLSEANSIHHNDELDKQIMMAVGELPAKKKKALLRELRKEANK